MEHNQEILMRVRINNSKNDVGFKNMIHYHFDCQSCGEEFGHDYFMNNSIEGATYRVEEVCPTIGCTNEHVRGVMK